MSKVYDTELQQRLLKFGSKDGIGSMAKAAQAIGYSTGTLSTYVNSKYGGDVAEVERKLREFFRVLDEMRAQPSNISPSRIEHGVYKPTSVSEHIYKTIRYCQLERGITIIHGDSGIGKTTAAAKFAKDNPGTAIYIEVSPITGVLSRFIRLVARAMRIPNSRDLGTLVEEIKAKLRGTNIVLIIDEAQHLKYMAMEEIRNWTQYEDITGKPGVGIVLIGNPQIYTKMQGRRSDLHEQQFNRSRPLSYTRSQITREDVELIFPGLSAGGMKRETEFLLSVCRSQWAIRNATYIWNDAVNSEDTSYESLRRIARSRNIMVA